MVIVLVQIENVCFQEWFEIIFFSSFYLEDFVLPREETRRLFRAYNQVWDLKIDEDKLQRVLDACARNGNTSIDDALKLFAKQT